MTKIITHKEARKIIVQEWGEKRLPAMGRVGIRSGVVGVSCIRKLTNNKYKYGFMDYITNTDNSVNDFINNF